MKYMEIVGFRKYVISAVVVAVSLAVVPVASNLVLAFEDYDEAIEQINNAYWRFYDVPGHRHQLIPLAKARDAAKKFLELF